MEIKNSRHEAWALRELNKIAEESSLWAEETVSTDSVIRLATYYLIIANRKQRMHITPKLIKDKEVEAIKLIE